MTHILYISLYYPPEKGVAAVCVSEFAKRLVKRGYEVTMLTTVPNHPTGIVPPEYRGHMLQEEILDGVRVVRVWSYVAPNRGFFRRTLAQFSFAWLAPLISRRAVGHPDGIIVESPPLFNAIAGRLLAWWKHCPLIFSVSDPWPEAAIQLGMLRNSLLIRLAEWLEWSTYQRASLVWVVSEKVRDMLIRRGLPPEHIFLLTNGADITKFRPLPQSQARQELGWDDRFTILYGGNHGLVYSMTLLLDLAERLQHYPDMHIVLAGDGPKKAELIAEAHSRNLKNITFLDSQPHDRMPLLLASADVCLIPLRRMPLNETTLPVKMFEIMASARPLILGGEGLVRQLVEQEAGAAICVEPENVTALLSAILNLREHPELGEKLGQRGRAFVEERFDFDQLTASLDARVAMLFDKKGTAFAQLTSTGVSTTTEQS
jgi:putative colanic acid biosynthesis glycosyltransferase WcaI